MPYPIREMKQDIRNCLKRLEEEIYVFHKEMKITVYQTKEPVDFSQKETGKKMELNLSDTWGELWDCGWFCFEGAVNNHLLKDHYVLLIDISGELCIYDEEGLPYQGLTNVNSEFETSLGKPGKKELKLEAFLDENKAFKVWGDGGCNDLFGNYSTEGRLNLAEIAICREQVKEVFYDYDFLYRLYETVDSKSSRGKSILQTLNQVALLFVDYSDIEMQSAKAILAKELNKKGGDHSLTVHAIGHAHIDLAWLWPIRETKRKVLRTFSTVLKHMENYPDYTFGASQAQLFEWVNEKHPQMIDIIKQRVEEKRWEIQGGMWVESDTNVPSGESLIRQILYGKRYFKETFNLDIKNLWLPDAFGYSSVLPQIMKKTGIDYFMTQKMSWNNYTQFPHQTFMWEGNDGSRVLTHMPPEETYNSPLAPSSVRKAEYNYIDAALAPNCLMLYGIGDGGGGPGEEHLERAKRIGNVEGLAPVKHTLAYKLFDQLDEHKNNYHVYHGPLYLERHQGTFTTCSKSKFYNNWFEMNLKTLELLDVMCLTSGLITIDKDLLTTIWKEVLLYQFHDILPGSSIKRVYDESEVRYEALMNQVNQLIADKYERLFGRGQVYFNSLPFNRTRKVLLNDQIVNINFKPYEYVKVESFISEETQVYHLEELMKKDVIVMDNDKLRLEFNHLGHCVKIYDYIKKRNLLVPEGLANDYRIYHDDGDAWDFTSQYRQQGYQSLEGEIIGFVKKGVKEMLSIRFNIKSSDTMKQSYLLLEVSLEGHNIEYKTTIHWYEHHKMLRTSFDIDMNTSVATMGNQYGFEHVRLDNNSIEDMAKYEVCAHNYVDVSEHDYGVALLCPTKYGYHVERNLMDMNMLRSSTHPGNYIDHGIHEVTYALYVHQDSFGKSHILRKAMDFAYPIQEIVNTGKHPSGVDYKSLESLVTVDQDQIMIDTIKISENRKGIIIRLHETLGARVSYKLKFKGLYQHIYVTDMLENIEASINIDEAITIKSFEVQTFYIEL